MKVKSGQFRMPEFPEDIKNLISRMLTVDPAKRISLQEIKEHPAFRRGIPPFYTFPSPLPIPSITQPIDLKQLDEDTLLFLKQFGYDGDDENALAEELSSDRHSMIKVFVYMLTNRMSLDNLPWKFPEKDENDGNEMETNPSFETNDNSSSEIICSGNVNLTIPNTSDRFYRKKNVTQSLNSSETYSMVKGSFLLDATPTMICGEKHDIQAFGEFIHGNSKMAATDGFRLVLS